MPVQATTVINDSAVYRSLHGPHGPAARATFGRGKRVEAAAKRNAPVDSGRLRASLHTELRMISTLPVTRVGTDVSYAAAVHRGTGIYGPHKTPIRPTHGRVLIWRPRGSARIIVARQVRGQRARPFLTDALRQTR